MESFSCQPLLDRLTHLLVKTGALEDFAEASTPLDKIIYCLEAEVVYGSDVEVKIRKEIDQLLEALYGKCKEHRKSESLALEAKNKGSKAYLKKKDSEALKAYTECLCLAPANSTIVPLAYANRSAVLYQMAKYEECLQDMERAEKTGYPSAIFHKLLTRRCSCYLNMQNKEKIQLSLEQCRRHVHEIPIEAREKFKKSVEDLEQKALCFLDRPKYTPSSYSDVECPALFNGESNTVKYMSNAMEMRVNSELGRHVVAKQKISKGSVVFAERPYATILLPEYIHTHCQTCLSPVSNPIPCFECCDVVFCSELCQSLGQAFHQYECGILHILSAVGIAHLAVRIILVTGWKLYCDIRNESVKGRVAGVGDSGVYNGRNLSDGYRAVYHLLPHFDSCLPEDQLQYCIAAIILATAVLDKTSFLKHNEDMQKDSAPLDVPYLASAIMRHIAQLVSNAHAVTQITTDSRSTGSMIQQVSQARIASAIYPTASLMNHSCKPNIINSFYKDKLVIRTIEDVENGNHITNCYGPHYCRQSREERQQSLKQQYFFKCRCEPCINPDYLRKEAAWSGFHCEACSGVATWTGDDKSSFGIIEEEGVLLCLQCHRLGRPHPLFIDTCRQVIALQEQAEEDFQKGDTSSAISGLRKAVALGSKVYLAENQYFMSLQDTLARCLGEAGDYEGCCKELRKCLQVTESRYGAESIELGHELLKYSDALSLALASNKRHEDALSKVRRRVDEIFTLNYGPHWKKYLGTELKE
ncbi:SET and MYND domain-containing protein 4-like [Penaeus japonicus]|uniref:SET and MYND domain-containing protein 4-like n=1 Tax=Penaeus japonicus TaxID=27405 RepID=UPI001C716F56|nr:SET and MYND domain-containing protein 4-like [Penaeus japonicus]